MPTGTCFALATSNTKANRSSPPTKNGSQRGFSKSIWTRSSVRLYCGKRSGFRPTFYPIATTSCAAKILVPLDPRCKTIDPLFDLYHGLGRQRCKLLQRQNSQAETKYNSDAGKSTPWPGATPFCPRFSGPKTPCGVPGRSRPQCSTPASSLRLAGLPPAISGNVLRACLDDRCNL